MCILAVNCLFQASIRHYLSGIQSVVVGQSYRWNCGCKMIAIIYLLGVMVVVVLLLALGIFERTTGMYKVAVAFNGPGYLLPIIGNSYVVWNYTASMFTNILCIMCDQLKTECEYDFLFYFCVCRTCIFRIA